MPKISEKEKLISHLFKSSLAEIVLNSDYEQSCQMLDELSEDILLVSANRRGVVFKIPKSLHWREFVLENLDEDRFKQMLRMSRADFQNTLRLIEGDEIFNTSQSVRQFPADLQLAIVLYRLGVSGDNASIRKLASIFGIGDGGTVDIITHRVFRALLNLKDNFIFWPKVKERKQIVGNTFQQLPYCVGYIDGTELKLSEMPSVNNTAYFSKNRVYSIKAQVICDYRLRVRHISVGHFGSTHDAKMFRLSPILTKHEQFFSEKEWIAGDSAYPLLTYLITPYRSNSQQLNYSKRKAFNLRHSQYRVKIENCFGILKERFGSLKELRVRVKNEESHQFVSDWFQVCCVLHNILINDKSEEPFYRCLEEYVDNDDDTFWPSNEAEIKRQALFSLMFGENFLC